MDNQVVQEYNDKGVLLFSATFPGAFTRAASLDAALLKFPKEIKSYCCWADLVFDDIVRSRVVQVKKSSLHIEDADSDVIFDSELEPLDRHRYQELKALVLKSAEDFQLLYDAIPVKDLSSLPRRKTFYGDVPRTAWEMYKHTSGVNTYYFAELGVALDHNPDILSGRHAGFAKLEDVSGFLARPARKGSYDEYWSLTKLLRRFIWHDRIHAKAMYRMAGKMWPGVCNPFCLE